MKIELQTTIVTNPNRTIVDMGRWEYIYIPLTDEEARLLSIDEIADPALRIRVRKEEKE